MINKSTFEFLEELKLNNNRDWFVAQKKAYEAAKLDAEKFVGSMIQEISKFDPAIENPDVKSCMFRIFKDVRFSKDKLPYKTNFGGFIGKGGRKTTLSGYYFHIEPGESMIAGGIYMPQPEVLKMLRNEIYFNSAEFKSILGEKGFKKYFDGLDDFDKMKKGPKDYPADFPELDLLKYKSYIVSAKISDADVLSAGFPEHAIKVAKAMLPLNTFLNRAILNS